MSTTDTAAPATRSHWYVEMRPEAGGPWVRYGASPDQQTPFGPYGGWATVNERRAFNMLAALVDETPTHMLLRVTSSGGYRGCTRNGQRAD